MCNSNKFEFAKNDDLSKNKNGSLFISNLVFCISTPRFGVIVKKVDKLRFFFVISACVRVTVNKFRMWTQSQTCQKISFFPKLPNFPKQFFLKF